MIVVGNIVPQTFMKQDESSLLLKDQKDTVYEGLITCFTSS